MCQEAVFIQSLLLKVLFQRSERLEILLVPKEGFRGILIHGHSSLARLNNESLYILSELFKHLSSWFENFSRDEVLRDREKHQYNRDLKFKSLLKSQI